MPAQLLAERRGATLILSISAPSTRNTLSEQVYSAGIEALNVAEADSELRCVVLRGDGAHFCAGDDWQYLAAQANRPPSEYGVALSHFHELIEALQVFPKPVIAAVEGQAAGSGVALALACDLVVAATDARFLLNQGQLGLSAAGGLSWQLMQQLPRALALQWLWLTEPLSAQQLVQHGLINWLAEPGETLARALLVAEQLAAAAPNVLASTKELINQWPAHSLPEQMQLERAHVLLNLVHPNAREGLRAHSARQTPRFGPTDASDQRAES